MGSLVGPAARSDDARHAGPYLSASPRQRVLLCSVRRPVSLRRAAETRILFWPSAVPRLGRTLPMLLRVATLRLAEAGSTRAFSSRLFSFANTPKILSFIR